MAITSNSGKRRIQYVLTNRSGFTLVELVVVVLILGIIAAVAAPKMFNTAANAKDNSVKQSLAVIRDAIELYKAKNGTYPGTDEASFKAALAPYIRGPFPKVPDLGQDSTNYDGVRFKDDGTIFFANGQDGSGSDPMWAYNSSTGEFIINYDAASQSGIPYDEW